LIKGPTSIIQLRDDVIAARLSLSDSLTEYSTSASKVEQSSPETTDSPGAAYTGEDKRREVTDVVEVIEEDGGRGTGTGRDSFGSSLSTMFDEDHSGGSISIDVVEVIPATSEGMSKTNFVDDVREISSKEEEDGRGDGIGEVHSGTQGTPEEREEGYHHPVTSEDALSTEKTTDVGGIPDPEEEKDIEISGPAVTTKPVIIHDEDNDDDDDMLRDIPGTPSDAAVLTARPIQTDPPSKTDSEPEEDLPLADHADLIPDQPIPSSWSPTTPEVDPITTAETPTFADEIEYYVDPGEWWSPWVFQGIVIAVAVVAAVVWRSSGPRARG
jgi:hypothetical protein